VKAQPILEYLGPPKGRGAAHRTLEGRCDKKTLRGFEREVSWNCPGLPGTEVFVVRWEGREPQGNTS